MKKFLSAVVVVSLVAGVSSVAFSASKKAAKAQEAAPVADGQTGGIADNPNIFAVYLDREFKKNHFAPSGWMGDTGDVKVDLNCLKNPHSGKSCIKISYSAVMSKNAGWAGVYWQYPVNNWGDNKKGGYKMSDYKKLTFWAKGEKGGEVISEFKMGGISGEFGDSDSRSVGPVTLTPDWTQYTIELDNADLTNIIGGFCWAASRDDNPDGFTVYLDDIQYEK